MAPRVHSSTRMRTSLLCMLTLAACDPGTRPGAPADAAPAALADATPFVPIDAGVSPLVPHHVWSHRLPYGFVQALVPAGDDLVLAGTFSGTIDPGAGPLVSAGFSDIVLARYDGDGALRWARRAGGSGGDRPAGAALAPDGDVWMLSTFQGDADFGGVTLHAVGTSDLALSRYHGDGTHVSTRQLGGTAEVHARGLAVDAHGRVAIAGSFHKTFDLGGGPLTSTDHLDDVFVAVYTPAGALEWAHRLGGAKVDDCFDVAFAPDGDLVLAGIFETSIDFGGGALLAQGPADGFVARFTSDGHQRWARRVGGVWLDNVEAIVAGPDGDTLAAGYFTQSADFGAGPVATSGVADAFVARWDQTGALRWIRHAPGFDVVAIYDLALAPDGAARVTGSFRDWADFDGARLAGVALQDVFMAGWAADGAPGFAWSAGGPDEDQGTGLLVAGNGDLLVAGWLAGSIDLGGGPLVGDGGTFLARMRP